MARRLFTVYGGNSFAPNDTMTRYMFGLVNASIRGGPSVGAFAGSNRGTITNCFVGGLSTVYGEGYVGGMVGYNSGNITKSYSTAHVNGIGYVGGLVGGNNSKIDQCYVTGTVQTTDSYIGGLSGFVSGDANYIRNSFFDGSLLCTDYSKSGGLVARILSGSVENCYSVSLSPNGLNGDGVPVNSYFDSDVGFADKPEARTTDQMMSQNTYAGWDFNSVWTIEEGQGYPYLRGVTKPDWTSPVISDTVPRDGDTVGRDPIIRAFAEDDADLLDVYAQYESNGEWRDIGRSAAFGRSYIARFPWSNGSYSNPTVNVRFYMPCRSTVTPTRPQRWRGITLTQLSVLEPGLTGRHPRITWVSLLTHGISETETPALGRNL